MKIIDEKNFFAGILYVLIGGAVAVAAIGFQIGSAARMGPGYFPLVVGMSLVVTGLVVLYGAVGPAAHSVSRIGRWDLKAVLAIAAAVVAFALTIRPLGLIVAVPALILIASFADAHRVWRTVFIAFAVLLPLTWVIFVAVLGLQLRLLPAFVGS